MPTYKDEQRGTWYCCFYYTDWQGNRKRKLKRGFSKQREAKEYEREFLNKLQGTPQMTFRSLVEIYMEDMRNRLRLVTMQSKEYIARTKLLPYWGDMPIADIKPTAIRQWQNELISKGYADTTLKVINNQLCAILNYAVRYYGLKENPCHIAGSMGKKKAKEMLFWTKEEYLQFIKAVEDRPLSHAAFQILYWCGLRVAELLALERADIDLEKKTISVSKGQQRIAKEDVITPPKTPKGNRIIVMPDSLCAELSEYLNTLFDKGPNARLFPVSRSLLYREIVRGCKASGVKKIRLHDLRHSHASLLIEMGYSPLLIAERLGHESTETTLNIYSHLYPNKQSELAKMLDK